MTDYYRPCQKAYQRASEYELYSQITQDHFKQDALQQLRVLCDCPPGLPLHMVQHDFSLEREWNQSMPEDTRRLFQYVHDNAHQLLEELCEAGLFEKLVHEQQLRQQ